MAAFDTTFPFRVSSFSGGGNCVAVRMDAEGVVTLRHSKDPTRELNFTVDEWRAFLLGVAAGEFGRVDESVS